MPRVYSRRGKLAEVIPADAVYVGRPTQFGNPFRVGRDGTQGECVELYRKWLQGPGSLIADRARRELRGKDLVCWCAPLPCHADVLLEIVNA